MKKMLALLLALMLMLSLCSCGEEGGGKKNDVPGNELIQQDLANALKTENEHATLKSCETVKSLTEEGKYLITMSVTAESKYADWTYEADLSYTKYDQGWVVDSVTWGDSSYTVMREPSVEDITTLANRSSELMYKHYDLSSNESIRNTKVYDFDEDNGTVRYDWELVERLHHADRIKSYYSVWAYDETSDNWQLKEYDGLDSDTVPHDISLNGTWRYPSTGTAIYTIEVSNFTWSGFNLKINGKNYGHFSISSGSDYTYRNDSNEKIYCVLAFYKDHTLLSCSNRVSYNRIESLGDVFITE